MEPEPVETPFTIRGSNLDPFSELYLDTPTALVYPERFYEIDTSNDDTYVHCEYLILHINIRNESKSEAQFLVIEHGTPDDFELYKRELIRDIRGALQLSYSETVKFIHDHPDMIIVEYCGDSEELSKRISHPKYKLIADGNTINFISKLPTEVGQLTFMDLKQALSLPNRDIVLMILGRVAWANKRDSNFVYQCVVSRDYLELILPLSYVFITKHSIKYCIRHGLDKYLSMLTSDDRFDASDGQDLVVDAAEVSNTYAMRLLIFHPDVYVDYDTVVGSVDNPSPDVLTALKMFTRQLDRRDEELKEQCGIDPIILDGIPPEKRIAWLENGAVQCFNVDNLSEWIGREEEPTNPLTRQRIPGRILGMLSMDVVIWSPYEHGFIKVPKKITIGRLLVRIWREVGLIPYSIDRIDTTEVSYEGGILTDMDPNITIDTLELEGPFLELRVRYDVPVDLTPMRTWGRENRIEFI